MTGIKSLNVERGLRPLLRVGLGLLLVSPYLLWLARIPHWTWLAVDEWFPQLMTATVQAAISAVAAMVFGFVLLCAALGWQSPRARGLAEVALLLPNLVPQLFLILAILCWVTPVVPFPFGIGAVVFAHVLLNSGLVAVSLERLLLAKAGSMAETAWTLGVSRSLFWRKIAWPYLRADMACIFLFVFSLCLTSFSIPLVLGGTRLATLEVAIFDAIRMDGRWDKALILAGLQSVVLFLLAMSLPQPFWPVRSVPRSLDYLAMKGWRVLVFAPAAFLVFGWMFGALAGQTAALYDTSWLAPAMTSAALGISVGTLHLCLFLLVAYVSPHRGLDRFLNGYLAPSPAIAGFALLLLPSDGELASFLKLSLALTLLTFPALYRWLAHSALAALHGQVQVARGLGAGSTMILFEVVWPQVAPQLLRASGLAALWASGDFAVSGILANQMRTLPLLIEDLMSNYRFENAQWLMFPLALIGLGLYGLFVGAAKYVRR